MRLASIVQRAANKLGFRLVHAPRAQTGFRGSDTGDYICGIPHHIDCDVLIDVGVAGGTPWLYDRFLGAELLLVEPLNVVGGLAALLRGRNHTMFECAAGAEPGEIMINYNVRRPGLSSIKTRTALTETGDALVQKTVPVRTIDDIVAEAGASEKNVGIKIDTEGFELEVLRGAVGTFSHCSFVICETSVARRFEDSYDFSELVAFMDCQDFYVSKFLNFRVDRAGYLRMADLLFEPR